MQSGKFWSAMARRGKKQTAMHFIFGALHFCHQLNSALFWRESMA